MGRGARLRFSCEGRSLREAVRATDESRSAPEPRMFCGLRKAPLLEHSAHWIPDGLRHGTEPDKRRVLLENRGIEFGPGQRVPEQSIARPCDPIASGSEDERRNRSFGIRSRDPVEVALAGRRISRNEVRMVFRDRGLIARGTVTDRGGPGREDRGAVRRPLGLRPRRGSLAVSVFGTNVAAQAVGRYRAGAPESRVEDRSSGSSIRRSAVRCLSSGTSYATRCRR